MKLSHFLLAAAVCAEEAAVVAPAAAAAAAVAPPPPVVCTCKSEVDQCVTKYEATMKERDARSTSKCQESLNSVQTLAKNKTDSLEKQIAELQGRVKEAQELIKSLESNSSSELTTLRSSLNSQKAAFEAQMTAEKATREKALADANQSVTEMTSRLAQANTAAQDLRNHMAEKDVQLASLERKLYSYENVLFSRAQLEVMTHNLKTIAKALLQNFKDNVNRVFKADIFELMRLQSLVLYSKVEPHVNQAQVATHNLAERFELSERWHDLEDSVKPYVNLGIDKLDQRMERIVRSLSKSNPEIRNMFPTDFVDRLLAFTYLATVMSLAYYACARILSIATCPFTMLQSTKRRPAPAKSATAASAAVAKTPTNPIRVTKVASAKNSAAETESTTTVRH